MQTPVAKFSLLSYRFNQVELNLENIEANETFVLDFSPSGNLFSEKGEYVLIIEFKALAENKDTVVKVKCNAVFSFGQPCTLDEIPTYFYSNSIAILFPYIRAFVSTLTLQANVKPILLPTLNLSTLQEELKRNTKGH